MSYRGNVAYQQQRGQDNYFYGGSRHNNNGFRNTDENRGYDGRPAQTDVRNYQQQQTNNDYDMRGGNYRRDVRDLPPPQPERINEYDRRNEAPPAVHRYPQTFQQTSQLPTPPESWSNNPDVRSYPQTNSNWRDGPSHIATNYGGTAQNVYRNEEQDNRQASSHPPLRQNQTGFDDQRQYSDMRSQRQGENRNWDDRYRNENPPSGQLRSSSWVESNDSNRASAYNNTNQHYRKQNDERSFPQQPNRDIGSSSTQYVQPAPSNNFKSYQSEREDHTSYSEGNLPGQRPPQDYYRNSYSENLQQRDTRNAPQPPQVLAKTSGSTAVFGIVARVDTSPSRRIEPVVTQNRNDAPPLSSPTRTYPSQFSPHEARDPPRKELLQESQPLTHHHHHALTPILEQPSPPLSPRSRLQSQERNWQSRNEPPNQYRNPPDTNQSWQSRNETDSYSDNRVNNRPKEIYNEKDTPVYNDFRPPYPDTRPPDNRPPYQASRPGYREHDYTESSGYGSESTHYTERSYNDQNQRFTERGQFESKPQQPAPQQYNNGPRSPGDHYSRSPPSRSQNDNFENRYRDDRIMPDKPREDDIYQNRQNHPPNQDRNIGPPDQYGPPITRNNMPQRRFEENQDRNIDPQYAQRNHEQGREPTHQIQGYDQHGDIRSKSQQRNSIRESGVERPHVKSVLATKSLFEKQLDPRHPPPAPKPIVPAKPNIVNARPVPPRPRNISESGWDSERRDPISPRSQHPPGPRSPSYQRPQYNGESQQFQPRTQPSHSLSMDNLSLDERSRYQSPNHGVQRPPQHAKSMHNLDERSRYPEESRPQAYADDRQQDRGYRNSYSGNVEERPMVLGVKYNQDTGPTIQTNQNAQKPQASWERPQPEVNRFRTDHELPTQLSPTRPYNDRRSWSNEQSKNNHNESYNNRNAARNEQSNYIRPITSNEKDDYVPDVVARSYELANKAANEPISNQQNTQLYMGHSSEAQQRNQPYNNRPPPPVQNFPKVTENLNTEDRWPTPPPPIIDDRQFSSSPKFPEPHQGRNEYSDDWRRPGPPPPQSGPPQYQHTENTNSVRQEHTVRFQSQTQEYPFEANRASPLQRPYTGDSDSSEVDVDAPTPPPSNKHVRPQFPNNQRGASSAYERNKPKPIGSRDPDSLKRQPYQATSSGNQYDQPSSPSFERQHRQDPVLMTGLPQPYHKPHQIKNIRSPGSKPQPKKPQRNSAVLSPQAIDQSPTDEQNEFNFDVRSAQPLTHDLSRERLRLGKSGALANRKPPSRTGSTSNLVEAVGTDEFQIEVTDSELSQQKGKIEVHREESMRILRAKKDSSSDTASSIQERTAKQRASQRVVPPPASNHSPAKLTSEPKKDSKLVYKLPSAEAAKTIPMPQVTEPAEQAGRRPPTYLDLLSQFKHARDSAMKTASEKQDRALKGVSALVKFSHGKKEPKAPPKPKLTSAEKNAKLLGKMHVEVKPRETEEHHSRHSPHKHDDTRSSVRSSSTLKGEKYDGDDDTTNGSKYDRDRRGRGRDRNRDDGRGKSRGRSSSRGREISPDDRNARSRHRSTSRERALSPNDRHRSHRDYDDRRRHADPPYHRRPPSPERYRYPGERPGRRSPPHHQYPPYDRNPTTREPDWVEQFRRGRERSSHPTRRAWVNDPRRVEVTPGGRRRELDMDAFERDVRKATSYNSDFEQPEPRRQMIPSKLSARSHQAKRHPPPGDWMNALKEKNKSAAKARVSFKSSSTWGHVTYVNSRIVSMPLVSYAVRWLFLCFCVISLYELSYIMSCKVHCWVCI
ncbi:uncharacterized protein LOC120342149 isoform X5 [Styela clava]